MSAIPTHKFMQQRNAENIRHGGDTRDLISAPLSRPRRLHCLLINSSNTIKTHNDNNDYRLISFIIAISLVRPRPKSLGN